MISEGDLRYSLSYKMWPHSEQTTFKGTKLQLRFVNVYVKVMCSLNYVLTFIILSIAYDLVIDKSFFHSILN